MRRTVQCQCQPFSPPANKDGCRIDTIVLTIDHINVNVSFSILISDDLKKMPCKGLFVCRSNNFLENCKFSQQDNDILQIGWDLLATPWPSFCTSSTFHWFAMHFSRTYNGWCHGTSFSPNRFNIVGLMAIYLFLQKNLDNNIFLFNVFTSLSIIQISCICLNRTWNNFCFGCIF